MQSYIWGSIPSEVWINLPDMITKAEAKLLQLALADKLGFRIPQTRVTNRWQDVLSLPHDTLTLKMDDGYFNTGHGARSLYSQKLQNKKEALPIKTRPYPGIWQEYIPKKREWRVVIIGRQIFAAAIYTADEAKDDWRQYSHAPGGPVRFAAEEFPAGEAEKCFKLLDHYNLRYGAFDFIEKPDGDIIFLECNPNGQYGWLEDRLKLPLSTAIADELIRIAG